MTASEAIALVRELKPRFLDDVAPSDLKLIVEAADHRRYLADTVILNQGHPADDLVLLMTGRARSSFTTRSGQRMLLRWLPAGEVVGLGALLARTSDYLISTEAIKNSSALVWDRATIRKLAARHPKLWENAFSIVSDYLSGYLAVHVSHTCHSARQRLARVLLDLASGIGHRTPAGIEINVRNEELANAANVTSFTTSRLLNEWQRNGLVVKSRGKILLRSPEGLLLYEV